MALPTNLTKPYTMIGGTDALATEVNADLDYITDALNATNLLINQSAGTATDLTARLAVTLNNDGTTKLTPASFGITASIAELNTLDGITASTAELNILDGITANTAELNYCDGVTSNIQTQLNGKQLKATISTLTVTDASGAGLSIANNWLLDFTNSDGEPARVSLTYSFPVNANANANLVRMNANYASPQTLTPLLVGSAIAFAHMYSIFEDATYVQILKSTGTTYTNAELSGQTITFTQQMIAFDGS